MGRFLRQGAALLALVCALELFLRLASFAWSYSPYYLFYGFHGWVGRVDINPWSWFGGEYYKFAPSYVSADARDAAGLEPVTWTINSRGFRGPDFTVAKPAGVFRVVCLGESNAFGYHIRDDQTYPFVLGKLFAREHLAVEVVNAAVPYDNSGTILSLLKNEIVNYEPDLLTFDEAYGDASWPIQIGRLGRLALWIQSHSLAYLVLRNNFDLVRDAEGRILNKLIVQTLPREELRKEVELVAARYRENVRSIVKLAKSRRIPIVFITQPLTAHNPNYASLTYEEENQSVREKFERVEILTYLVEVWMLKQHRLMEELRKIAKEEKIPVVDNIRMVDRDRRRLASWVHLTVDGDRRLAEALERVIKPYVLRAQAAARDGGPRLTRVGAPSKAHGARRRPARLPIAVPQPAESHLPM